MSLLTKLLLLWFIMAFFHLFFHFRGCLGLLWRLVAIHLTVIPIYSSPVWSCPVPLAQCWVLWLPGAEQTFPAFSSGLPAFLRSRKNHQKSWCTGNWERNFSFFGRIILAKPISWPHWWQEMVLAQERKWGWAGVFGGRKWSDLGRLLNIAVP